MADPLARILADCLREITERKAAGRAERRAKLTIVEQPKRRRDAA